MHGGGEYWSYIKEQVVTCCSMLDLLQEPGEFLFLHELKPAVGVADATGHEWALA